LNGYYEVIKKDVFVTYIVFKNVHNKYLCYNDYAYYLDIYFIICIGYIGTSQFRSDMKMFSSAF
jgi:hypothetical protein